MAGLYIHVPFCAKRCLYCDFFSNTEMKYKEPYINALIKEMELRKGYIGNEALETIYFGGGTPSQLDEKDFGKIFEAIYRLFDVAEQAEITLEANPDDMKREYVSLLRNYPFNRVSMGVQSFHPEDLRFLNRRHDREQAIKAVELCKEYGITNISIDLIYGLPNQTKQAWEENLRQAIRLDVPHLSAYHLIYEEVLSSRVVMVALSQLDSSGSEQNFSGWPKDGSCAAIFFHRSQPLPGLMVGSKPAALS